MKRLLINLAKLGISIAILAFLVSSARDHIGKISSQEKDWGLLVAAGGLCLLMVVTTIVRWYLLVRALDLPFTLRDAFRLGFLGFLFNFVSLGSVGGDFFKAIFIAREQPGHRAEAVATVVIDRIIGLYALFLVASVAVLVTGLFRSPVREIQIICNVTLILTVVGAVGIGLLLTPGFTNGRLSTYISNLPQVGHVMGRLLNAVRVYRSKLPVLVVTTLMSVGVHCLTTIALFLVSRGLPGVAPGFGAHFLCVPLAVLASAMPLPLSGLGAMEAVLDFLYVHVPSEVIVAAGTGLMVSLTYRVITIAIAIIGFAYYLKNRLVVSQVMHEAEAAEESEGDGDSLPEDFETEPAATVAG